MLPYTGDHFGNPSSVRAHLPVPTPHFPSLLPDPALALCGQGHAFGRPCAAAVDTARDRLAKMIRATPSEVIFTSCGSESDNHAIHIALARAKGLLAAGVTPHIVTTNIEHPAIDACLAALEGQGAVSVTRVGVDSEGLVGVDEVAAAVKPGATVLVTIMHSNNEVGAVQPIAEIGAAVRAKEGRGRAGWHCLLHTDAAQSVCLHTHTHTPPTPTDLPIPPLTRLLALNLPSS